MNDPLGTAALRDAALAAWSGNPARLREDANAEEDHARGWYRDRVVVELAQNAADAAARAGGPGRLELTLRTDGAAGAVLVAANTGAPLDAAGVASLASLRASAKRAGGSVGRFGVGFAAVRSVADAVTVASATGTVRFTLDDARALLAPTAAEDEALAAEVDARGTWLPVLRLPVDGPAHGHPAAPPDGWATAVALTLRDAAAVDRVREQLAAVDDVLLLALPALAEVTVRIDDAAPRVVRDVERRWVVARRAGEHDPALLADRPVEEQGRTAWEVAWAVPRERSAAPDRPATGHAATVHAPTPTDEPCTVPALLIGTFPLDPTRRHVAAGPVTDALVREAAAAWADLLTAPVGLPPLADLLPTGLPAGPLDAALVAAVLDATRRTPVLVPAAGGPRVAPADALVLATPAPPALVRLLGATWPGLVDVGPAERRVARLLRVATTDLADAVDGLPDLAPPAARALYEACAGVDAATLEQLATVPVPLADGRTVRGPRGLLLVEDADDDVTRALAAWGIRVVHPLAAHPMLERLGAERTGLADLARSAAVRARVLDAPDDAEPLLTLVRAAAASGVVEPAPWWGEVLLPAEDGELLPARGLVLAGSDAHADLDPQVLPAVDPAVEERWGPQVLALLGVRAGLPQVRVRLDDADDLLESLDGWADWLEHVGHDLADAEVPAVADLDAVLPDAWPRVLARLVTDHRGALAPVGVPGRTAAPAYTTWWLRYRGGLGLDRPFAVGPVAPAWLPPAPEIVRALDDDARRLLGGVGAADDLTADDWAALLDDLAPGDDVPLALAVELWRACARLAGSPGPLADLDLLPALTPDGVRAVAAEDVAVAGLLWAQRPDCGPLLVVPASAVAAVAHALDLDRADERAPGVVTSRGEEVPTPDAVRAVFPAAPASWLEHDDLRVDGVAVDWWWDGRVHAATTVGLARGLAEAVGPRHAARLARLIARPDAVAEVLLELAAED